MALAPTIIEGTSLARDADEETFEDMEYPRPDIREVVTWPRRASHWLFDEVKYLVRVLVSSIDRFYWDNGFSRAASLAYSTLFALVPVTALFLGFLGSFKALDVYIPDLGDFIFRQFLPDAVGVTQVVTKVREFSETVASLNVVTIPFILITSLLLINSIEYALNQVWQVFEARTVAHRIGIYCAILVLAPILAISAFYTAKFRVEPLLLTFSVDGGFVDRLYDGALPFFIDFIAFFSLYFLVPKAPVQVRSASFGALIAATLFDIAKGGFAVYIRGFSSYEKIYGTLATIPIFLFWLYLAWAIVLFGCELAYQVQYLPRTGRLWKRQLLSVGDGRLILAVQSLLIVARAFERGHKLPNDLELAVRLGCSILVLKPALDSLRAAGIITRGDSRDMPISLARSSHLITLEQIRVAVSPFSETVHFGPEIARVFCALDERVGRSEASPTLEELMSGPLSVDVQKQLS
jgi:membrane protein